MIEGSADEAPDEAAMAAVGLRYEGPAPADFIVWPENWKTVEVFSAMGTQWNHDSMGRRTGLRYETLPTVLGYSGVKKSARPAVFQGLRVMEQTALECWNKS